MGLKLYGCVRDNGILGVRRSTAEFGATQRETTRRPASKPGSELSGQGLQRGIRQ